MGKWRYGVILDAGSSGTRAYVYRWLKPGKAKEKADEKDLGKLPKLHTRKKWTKKIHPGLSTFGEKPESVGPDHLAGLVKHVLEVVPDDEVEDTPIFLMATAGMRLLPERQRKEVLANVCSYFRKTTKFQLPDCDLHIQVIPGETEGLYGWLAANYLLGGFDDSRSHAIKSHPTYGFLDLGGASAQIAFAPNATEAEKHAEDLTLLRLRTVGGQPKEFRIFVTTWLEYGVNEARRRFLEAMAEAYPGERELPDPCLPSGLIETLDGKVMPKSAKGKTSEPHLLGTGKFTECLKQTFPLLDKESIKVPCKNHPCLLHGVHVPAIDFDVNHFVGVSEYWHTTHSVFEASDKTQAYDFKTYQAKVDKFCSQDWSAIQSGVGAEKWGKKVDEKTAAEVCFKASWLINMLHEGIGIPRVGLEQDSTHGKAGNKTKQALEDAKDRGLIDTFQAVDKVDGTEVSWTLGKMVLYASSQHPPADQKFLPVGFGSNVPGPKVPADFQFPSGGPDGGAGADAVLPSSSLDVDWHDKLFASASHRRVPGLLLFFFILVVAGFLLCGRERRHYILAKLTGRSPRSAGAGASSAALGKRNKRGGLLGRLLGGGPRYERLDGAGPDAADFELGDVPDADYSDQEDFDAGLSPAKRRPNITLSSTKNGGLGHTALGGGASAGAAGVGGGAANGSGVGKDGRYFDASPMSATSATSPAVGAAPFSRTESRERLTLGNNGSGLHLSTSTTNSSGSRSRHASPVRRASPLTTFKGFD